MMSKYLCLAAVGTVGACPIQNAMNNMDKPLFGLLEKGEHCPESDAPKMNVVQANRELMRNIYIGYTKGVYQENKNVVDDSCFGEWIEPSWTAVNGLAKKIQDDFWSVSFSEVRDVADQALDTFYKNAEACNFQRLGDDGKNWCMENPGQCFFMAGLENRLYDDPFGMAADMLDMYKLFKIDDSCYTDEEIMAEVYRLSVDMGELSAQAHGFDYKWDQSVERKHIKKSTFEAWKFDTVKTMLVKNPWEYAFPQWYPMFKQWEHHVAATIDSFGQVFAPPPPRPVHHVPQPHPQPKKPVPHHTAEKKVEPHHKNVTPQPHHSGNHHTSHHKKSSFWGTQSWF